MSEIPINLTQMPTTDLSTIEPSGLLTKKESALEGSVTTTNIEFSSMGKKELALERAGATREIAYKTMVEGLGARSMTVDKFGEEHFTEDHSSRLKAAELISRLNGDLKTETVIDNRTVTVSGIGAGAITELLHMVKDVAAQLAGLRTSGQQTGEIIDIKEECSVNSK